MGLRQVCHIYLFGGHVWKVGADIGRLYPDDRLKCSVTAVGVVCCWSQQECAPYGDLPLLPGLPLDPGRISTAVGVSKFLSAVRIAQGGAPSVCDAKKCGKKCTRISIVTQCDLDMKKSTWSRQSA